MAADQDVCNDSLGQIGESQIAALDDGTVKANYCRTFYPAIVDDAIRRYNWACARFFRDLAEALPVPTTAKWTHKFTLPTDPWCLAVRRLNDDDAIHWEVGAEVGSRVLYTKELTANIEFSGRVTDPTLWDASLYQAITIGLASKLVAAIKHDYRASRELLAMYQAVFSDATYHSAQESKQEETSGEGPLVLARGD